MVELSRSNFREVVDREAIVLIECWSPSCGVCPQFHPTFARVAESHGRHTFARMNVKTDEKLGEYFAIEYTPSLMLYRDGLLLLKKPGNFGEEELTDIIRQAESLNMSMVRAELEPRDSHDREKGKEE
jgi:thioredoxin 1